MTNHGVQHCPKIGASFDELGGISASELRVWQNDYLRTKLEEEKYLFANGPPSHCPKIGASWDELYGSESWINMYMIEQLAREDRLRNPPQPLAFVREPGYETMIPLTARIDDTTGALSPVRNEAYNPLLDMTDKIVRERLQKARKLPKPRTETNKPLFNILNARAKSKHKRKH